MSYEILEPTNQVSKIFSADDEAESLHRERPLNYKISSWRCKSLWMRFKFLISGNLYFIKHNKNKKIEILIGDIKKYINHS